MICAELPIAAPDTFTLPFTFHTPAFTVAARLESFSWLFVTFAFGALVSSSKLLPMLLPETDTLPATSCTAALTSVDGSAAWHSCVLSTDTLLGSDEMV